MSSPPKRQVIVGPVDRVGLTKQSILQRGPTIPNVWRERRWVVSSD